MTVTSHLLAVPSVSGEVNFLPGSFVSQQLLHEHRWACALHIHPQLCPVARAPWPVARAPGGATDARRKERFFREHNHLQRRADPHEPIRAGTRVSAASKGAAASTEAQAHLQLLRE